MRVTGMLEEDVRVAEAIFLKHGFDPETVFTQRLRAEEVARMIVDAYDLGRFDERDARAAR